MVPMVLLPWKICNILGYVRTHVLKLAPHVTP